MKQNITRHNLTDLEFDKEHIWHPYTSMIDPLPVYKVTKACGVHIYLEDEKSLIDGMSSWWCAIHGYNNPALNCAAEQQLKKMSHIMFGGLTHEPAISLARKLVEMTPKGLDKVFFCDSGSVAVEVAVKMALQYQISSEKPSKNKIATIRGGYHGDTWHAMSVCDPVGGMHSLYTGRLPIQFFVPRPTIEFDQPWDDSDFEPMRQLFQEHSDEIAAVIIEPIVQGAGGMWIYHPQYLSLLSKLCKQHGALLIADEIATGFGRTGKMFACEWAKITPDIMCLGKAITGGYMSFAATMATSEVALAISSGNPSELMHGPTFMGNPLACAIANASMDLLINQSPLERISQIEQILKDELCGAIELPQVANVRVLGAIGVLEMTRPVNMAECQREFVERGVWVRPFGKLIYIMPQYVISDSQLRTLCKALVEVATLQNALQ